MSVVTTGWEEELYEDVETDEKNRRTTEKEEMDWRFTAERRP